MSSLVRRVANRFSRITQAERSLIVVTKARPPEVAQDHSANRVYRLGSTACGDQACGFSLRSCSGDYHYDETAFDCRKEGCVGWSEARTAVAAKFKVLAPGEATPTPDNVVQLFPEKRGS